MDFQGAVEAVIGEYYRGECEAYEALNKVLQIDLVDAGDRLETAAEQIEQLQAQLFQMTQHARRQEDIIRRMNTRLRRQNTLNTWNARLIEQKNEDLRLYEQICTEYFEADPVAKDRWTPHLMFGVDEGETETEDEGMDVLTEEDRAAMDAWLEEVSHPNDLAEL
ncbi:hypothetical protein PHYBOEH_008710 [Phytophthora boehmeriae]|uniref:Uncharacterized protein n=1 Tax=Phytophthora boehmeriae TaxID=109152 RepID=A0A8T1W2Z1_9STRA|nr:hypothetical protein PHYBOEH_008710 [Phytophthora boehmeriae]